MKPAVELQGEQRKKALRSCGMLYRKKKEMELVAGSTYGNVMAHEMAHLQK